jgi:transcriptional regulator with XRE-family HTH domain
MKPLSIKEKAISYRRRGYSYGMISERLGLTKSTLSDWLHDIDFVPNKKVLSRIERNKRNLVKVMYQKRKVALEAREKIKNKAKQEIKDISKKDLWYIGTIFYLAEGNKVQREVRVTNSDPRAIKLIVFWLKEICGVKIERLAASVHLYPDNDIKKSLRFWSEVSGIPLSQFQKTQVDKRIKKSKIKRGRLPHGTLHIKVRKSGDLFYRISGWTEGILENINDNR